MERWLRDQPAMATNVTSVANSDFERFLNERALAADALPASQPKDKDKKADPFGL